MVENESQFGVSWEMNSRLGHTESKEITARSFAENVGAVREQGLLREPVNEMDKNKMFTELLRAQIRYLRDHYKMLTFELFIQGPIIS